MILCFIEMKNTPLKGCFFDNILFSRVIYSCLRLITNHITAANGAKAADPQGRDDDGFESDGVSLGLRLEIDKGVFMTGGTSVGVSSTEGAGTVPSAETMIGVEGNVVGV